MIDHHRNPTLYLQTVKQILRQQQALSSLPPMIAQLKGDLSSMSFNQLDTIMQQDPSLTAVILKTANSAIYKRVVAISSLKDAIATLGLGTVQSLVVAHQLKSMFQVRDPKLSTHLHNRWQVTLRYAACCKKIAVMMHMDADLAYLSAVLSDLGSSLIAQEFPRFQRDGDPPVFNWVADHYSHLIAAQLLSQWQFDPQVCLAIKKKSQWHFKSEGKLGLPELLNFCWVHVLNDEKTPELQDLPRFHDIPSSIRMLAGPRQFFLLKDY